MRSDRDISSRMREMLVQDKIFIREGFLTAMKSDLGKLLDGYFELASPIGVAIDRECDGAAYTVRVTFAASNLRSFDTTLDIKRF